MANGFLISLLETSKLVNPIQIDSEKLPSATIRSPAVSCNGCASDESREVPEAIASGSPDIRIPEQASSNCARVYCEELCSTTTTRIGRCVVWRRGSWCLLAALPALPWESASRKSWSPCPGKPPPGNPGPWPGNPPPGNPGPPGLGIRLLEIHGPTRTNPPPGNPPPGKPGGL